MADLQRPRVPAPCPAHVRLEKLGDAQQQQQQQQQQGADPHNNTAAHAPHHSLRGVAVITIAKEPVNSFDTRMWDGLHAALKEAEADPSISAVVIRSGLARRVFTAGNDLKELYAPLTSAERYAEFWDAQSSALVALHGSRLATVAAVRGACPAGGCAIALCCDARVMTSSGAIGLNEVALGIPVPKFWAGLMAKLVGPAQAEKLLLSGAMLEPRRALALGLVDELVQDDEALMRRATEVAAAASALPARARAETKSRLRDDYGREWLAYAREWEAGPHGYARIEHPDTVAAVRAALERLGGGGGKGGRGGGGGGKGGGGGGAKPPQQAKL